MAAGEEVSSGRLLHAAQQSYPLVAMAMITLQPVVQLR
jgi:hypothetical protein